MAATIFSRVNRAAAALDERPIGRHLVGTVHIDGDTLGIAQVQHADAVPSEPGGGVLAARHGGAKGALHLRESVDEMIGGAARAHADSGLPVKRRTDPLQGGTRTVALQALAGRELCQRPLASGFGWLQVASVLSPRRRAWWDR